MFYDVSRMAQRTVAVNTSTGRASRTKGRGRPSGRRRPREASGHPPAAGSLLRHRLGGAAGGGGNGSRRARAASAGRIALGGRIDRPIDDALRSVAAGQRRPPIGPEVLVTGAPGPAWPRPPPVPRPRPSSGDPPTASPPPHGHARARSTPVRSTLPGPSGAAPAAPPVRGDVGGAAPPAGVPVPGPAVPGAMPVAGDHRWSRSEPPSGRVAARFLLRHFPSAPPGAPRVGAR